MRINIELNGNAYGIDVDDKCYTPFKVGVNSVDGSRTEYALGYYKNINYAALRCCREEIALSEDVVSLKEFADRVGAINKQLLDQLEAVSV